MALVSTTPVALTKDFERSASVIAFPTLDAVFGAVGDDKRRDVYHVNLYHMGNDLVRLFFAPAGSAAPGGHPITDKALEDRPDCECMQFQARCLDADGHWIAPRVCKHIFARMVAVLTSPALTMADKADWLKLARQTIPNVNAAELTDPARLHAVANLLR